MNDSSRYYITLTGIVQGVGFRPFVYRIAKRLHLSGWVENQGSRVVIDIEGQDENLKIFTDIIQNCCPEQASITDVQINSKPFLGYSDFWIRTSEGEVRTANYLPPDLAVCNDCLTELNSFGAERYKYPFISCTNCGPRYSIIKRLPYDRDNTSMSIFPMCSHCTEEYEDSRNRRFHAQTNCCPQCGPVLKLLDAKGCFIDTLDPIHAARQLICKGKILAVKGVGGYHLCCNAEDATAVQKLRDLKRRPHKPLAVMARNLEAVNHICVVSEKEKQILTGKKKPILLLHKKTPEYLPESVAPNQKRLGIMLPYTPLHFLLCSPELEYLIMTSGNLSGSRISYQEREAITSLNGIADYYLTHNRNITIPVDDAVVKVANEQEVLLRCGRGFAPLTLPLGEEFDILALGAEQKSSICMSRDGHTTVSQYIGDLSEYQSYQVFVHLIEHGKALFKFRPSIYVHDGNMDYLSSKYAQQQEGSKIAIQHHHAHMAGCMAENKLNENVIGVIFDGTGLGTDGAVWGGEFFTGTRSGFKRAGHVKYVTLQGGDSVVKEPWRCAACYLLSLGIESQSFLPAIDGTVLDAVKAAKQAGIQCYESSSMGRLFDCVAALCGFQTSTSYEAQAAIELEGLIDTEITDFYQCQVRNTKEGLILDYEDIIKGVIFDIQKEKAKTLIATKFHNTVIEAAAECVCTIREYSGLTDVVLSGGVFDNTYLLEGLTKKLKQLNFQVYFNRLTPSNDGGLSFGQAMAAGAILKENSYVSCSSRESDASQ